MSPRDRAGALALGVSLPFVSCGKHIDGSAGKSLLDERHPPEVLQEEREIAWPGNTSCNRFLSGWRAIRQGRRYFLETDDSGGRLQFIQLEDRERTLVVDLKDDSLEPDSHLLVTIEGHEMEPLLLADPLEIEHSSSPWPVSS